LKTDADSSPKKLRGEIQNPPPDFTAIAAKLILSLTVIVVVAACVWRAADWTWQLLFALAVVSTVVSLARMLPWQNAITASLIIVFVAGVVVGVGAVTGVPFGQFICTDAAGQRLFKTLPWPLPFVWLVAIVNCRGVARLALRPWRKVRNYGFRVIGLTCLLVALFDLGLEPFASRMHRLWVWEKTVVRFDWFGAPWLNFFGWAMTTLLVLAVVTPWLINKSPARRPPDFHPLFLWLALNVFLAVNLASQKLWLAVAVVVVESAVLAPLAWRNARG
jgi:uncharacterized membrane protein